MTKVIGLTGGIGSGKSTVAQLLADLGAVVIDADKLGHEAFRPNTEAWREVVTAFGERIIGPGGEIDRRKLGEIVFKDPAALARLNQIMHPRMYEIAKSRIEESRRQGVKVVVLEAALLIEAKWTPLVDEVWVTIAPESRVLERLEMQRGLARGDTLSRIRSQLSQDERARHAAVVINNSGDLLQLVAKVKELWAGLDSNAKRG
ncbi:MAG: dephospho-CoA kinase [Chloroflexi bacterium]|nr:dephospho-CoA kinase [Chloroflexota bacterium]